jgi:hypothetical protein
MKQHLSHLSPEQIERWMAGERTASEEQHAGQCAECGAELARLESALGLFRSSVRQWSEQQSVARPRTWGVERAPRVFVLRWAMVVAALLMLVWVPIYQGAKEKQRKAELARADAALLEQVDAEISRAVPEPMEPLIGLVAWDSASTNQKGTKDGRNQ